MLPSAELVQELIHRAKSVAEKAYAPYSRFRVGAALLTPSGRFCCGCNVENASYGLTICAERGAICQLLAGGESSFDFIVIYTPTPEPTTPCGACRQVLFEFNPAAQVLCVCDGPGEVRITVSELLPGAFGPKAIGCEHPG